MSIVSYPDPAIHHVGDAELPTEIRFTVGTTMDGYEVLDRDGRPLAQRFSIEDARDDADLLNEQAMVSPKALAKAIAGL